MDEVFKLAGSSARRLNLNFKALKASNGLNWDWQFLPSAFITQHDSTALY